MTMTRRDALNVLGIALEEVTPEITKQAYRKAAQQYHPDRNPAIDNVNTPLNCEQSTQFAEIKVVDPKHPLFGQQFSMLSYCKHVTHGDGVLVKYQQGDTLRIPLSSTNLGYTPITFPTKLSSLALEDFLSLAKECQLICQRNNRNSGDV